MKWLMTFLLGVLVGASGLFLWLREVPDDPAPVVASAPAPAPAPIGAAPAAPADSAVQGTVVQTDLAESDLPLRPSSVQSSTTVQAPADAVAAPARLLVPVQGIKLASLSDTFDQPRGSQRHHEALDIMAPKGTPVLAAADGKVVKLFESRPGGTTLYQFDPSGRYAYYYAHLDRYADGVKEGMELKRGDLIGYVGVTGNSDPNAPHLHFSVIALTPEKQWWKGTPLNPYPLMTD
ncbi:M23 family metallopeptidase [Massilia sp. H6]|uniref:M23 family metallopeptidase n=1 Tax=Massilia sp. H6 TaxID=2970464 RepID=UPI00216A0320|nr:M23 family metallopeptidase [Massilia sp. H6]UVW30235.1 M23 family metallopeptidase [Massilia sp. H6]